MPPPAKAKPWVEMIQPLAVAVMALLVPASAALAQTKTLAGDKGMSRQALQGAKLYDAAKATVHVEQGKNNTGYNVTRSPAGATFAGGRTLGKGINRTQPWADVYSRGNGACVRFENSAQFTVRRHYGEFCWDGLKPAGGSGNWRVEDSWLKHIRDDAIEADHGGAHSGIVRRTFLDGVHTFLSVTPGQGGAIGGRPRVEFHDNLMSLGCGLDGGKACENRAKRLKYAWARPQGSGQAFKSRGCGADVDMLFRNNVVMMETGVNTAASNLVFFQCLRLLPGSTGNTFYWLGGCSFRGLEMTKLHGACVPARFKLDPKVWTKASNSRSAWQAEVARWQKQVWKGAAPASADETAETDPATETLVAVDVRPQQCPNRVRADKSSSIPVVIAGTDGFDVRDIDPKSIRLAGVAPNHDRTRFRDRASPFEPLVGKEDAGDCTRDGADGLEDMLLRFNSRSVGKSAGPVSNGGTAVIRLTGALEDGTPIRGEEVIVIFK
jgi:hypothetical protein